MVQASQQWKRTNELIKEGRTNERASECIVLYYNGMFTRYLLQDLSDIQMEICEVDHLYLIMMYA